MRMLPAVFIAVCLAGPSLGDELRVEPLKEAPPADALSKEVAGALSSTGLRVTEDDETVCDIWLAEQWSVKPDFQPTLQVLYPFEPGQFIGVMRLPGKFSDFRDQTISKGVYTLRYAQQPVDGNHVGTSPTRDFLVLVAADKDKKVAQMKYDELASLSAEAAESTHPALLCMQNVVGKETPAMRHFEQRQWWMVRFEGQAKAGKTEPLPVELIVSGHAAE